MIKTPQKTKSLKNQKSKSPALPPSADATKVFGEHLTEVKYRLSICFVFLILSSIAGYLLHTKIFDLLITPLNQPIFYSSPAGGFDFVIKISFFFGFVVTVPVIIYHAIKFVEPIMPENSPKQIILFLFSSCMLLLLGMLFAYFISLPAALYFLNAFTTDQVNALISTTEYFSFVTRYLLGFGILFQLPLILLIVNSIKKISTQQFMSFQKWVILASFIVAAILTPTPDIFNQLIMAVPLILLYQFSIGLIYVVNRKNK